MKIVLQLPSKFESAVSYNEEARTLELSPRVFPTSFFIVREENDGSTMDSYRVVLSRSRNNRVKLGFLHEEKNEIPTIVKGPGLIS